MEYESDISSKLVRKNTKLGKALEYCQFKYPNDEVIYMYTTNGYGLYGNDCHFTIMHKKF